MGITIWCAGMLGAVLDQATRSPRYRLCPRGGEDLLAVRVLARDSRIIFCLFLALAGFAWHCAAWRRRLLEACCLTSSGRMTLVERPQRRRAICAGIRFSAFTTTAFTYSSVSFLPPPLRCACRLPALPAFLPYTRLSRYHARTAASAVRHACSLYRRMRTCFIVHELPLRAALFGAFSACCRLDHKTSALSYSFPMWRHPRCSGNSVLHLRRARLFTPLRFLHALSLLGRPQHFLLSRPVVLSAIFLSMTCIASLLEGEKKKKKKKKKKKGRAALKNRRLQARWLTTACLKTLYLRRKPETAACSPSRHIANGATNIGNVKREDSPCECRGLLCIAGTSISAGAGTGRGRYDAHFSKGPPPGCASGTHNSLPIHIAYSPTCALPRALLPSCAAAVSVAANRNAAAGARTAAPLPYRLPSAAGEACGRLSCAGMQRAAVKEGAGKRYPARCCFNTGSTSTYWRVSAADAATVVLLSTLQASTYLKAWRRTDAISCGSAAPRRLMLSPRRTRASLQSWRPSAAHRGYAAAASW